MTTDGVGLGDVVAVPVGDSVAVRVGLEVNVPVAVGEAVGLCVWATDACGASPSPGKRASGKARRAPVFW